MKDISDWISLPGVVFVTAARTDGIVHEINMCSVPMAMTPEVRYVRADNAALEYERGRRDVLEAITYTTPDGAIHNSFYDYVDLREKLQ